jgi:hypothetical protein
MYLIQLFFILLELGEYIYYIYFELKKKAHVSIYIKI